MSSIRIKQNLSVWIPPPPSLFLSRVCTNTLRQTHTNYVVTCSWSSHADTFSNLIWSPQSYDFSISTSLHTPMRRWSLSADISHNIQKPKEQLNNSWWWQTRQPERLLLLTVLLSQTIETHSCTDCADAAACWGPQAAALTTVTYKSPPPPPPPALRPMQVWTKREEEDGRGVHAACARHPPLLQQVLLHVTAGGKGGRVSSTSTTAGQHLCSSTDDWTSCAPHISKAVVWFPVQVVSVSRSSSFSSNTMNIT